MANPNVLTDSPKRPRGGHLVTRSWVQLHRAERDALSLARRFSPIADTALLIPAAQHPLVDGVRPGREFANRLGATVDRYVSIVERGGNAEFFLPGSRHHDVDSGQTDKVALHDAAGLWLVKEGIPPEVLNGKAWIDRYRPEGVYSGAEEIAVAASGFSENFRFEIVEYFCSHGQASRARTYALAHGLPARAVVIPPDTIEDEGEQFHDGSLKKRLQMFVGIVLAQTVDPYGEGALYNRTRNRIPADGNIGTIPELLDEYAVLPWYSAGAPEATL